MKNNSYQNFFANLANKSKLDILLSLKDKPLSVNEIAKKIKEEQSNVSHHLKSLSDCHIVYSKKQGKKRIYSLNNKTISPILKLVQTHAAKNCSDGCSKNCKGCSNE
ncbi:winged helix-turn-helix transcriptional regulator [Candidatus Pacearchaeota archaeon]|nr:winged helix-turn-helix transcriptional regulator [Candidatus Pacearchaeota archaeon]